MNRQYKTLGNFSHLPYELVLDAIVNSLTPKQQKYCFEYYFSHRSMKEIASRYGVSVSCVSRTVTRANARLADKLKYAEMK